MLMRKRVLLGVLSVALVVGLMPEPAAAAEGRALASETAPDMAALQAFAAGASLAAVMPQVVKKSSVDSAGASGYLVRIHGRSFLASSDEGFSADVEIDPNILIAPGEMVVSWYWELPPKKRISGYEIQVSTGKSFKSKRVLKAPAGADSKRITGLKAGKRYYVRMRGFAKVGGKTYYSIWSGSERSDKIGERTAESLDMWRWMRAAYKKIKRVGVANGWTVGPLFGSTAIAYFNGSSSTLPLWCVNCRNSKYSYRIEFNSRIKSIRAAYLRTGGETVKELHFGLAPDDHEKAMLTNLKKGVLADLKKFSTKYKRVHLDRESADVSPGDKVVFKVLNTKEKVTWDFVRDSTLKPEANAEYAACIKKGMKLKRLSKSSVRLTIAKGVLPYGAYPSSYYLRARVAGKTFYAKL